MRSGLRLGGLLLLSACTLNSHGPWLTADGVRLQNSLVLEYTGDPSCDQQSVTFLVFFGNQYAKDPEGALGQLASVDGAGRVLAFELVASLPADAETTGINHEFREGRREIWLVPDQRDDYLFMVYDDGRVERWPRAEVDCG